VSSAPAKVDRRRARGADTRTQILDAVRDVLVERGYTGTTTRAVAERAGLRVSLVHYHFGGKQQLLAAVLDRENDRLLARQEALFTGAEPLAEKWRTACAYLREDIGSGYVRILWELWAVGLVDEELAAHWRKAIEGWRELLARAAVEWAAELELELPLPPRALATLVVAAFLGAEAEMLAGVDEKEAPHLEALERCAELIEWVERGKRDSGR
jgi:AcrR family transcriptional regulator